MRSYIKIYGPPVAKAIKALQKIAIDMPEVCIMDTIIQYNPGQLGYAGDAQVGAFFEMTGAGSVPVKRCSTIISKSGVRVGDADFYFEWFKNPTDTELNMLIEKIDAALTPLKCYYTITTKA